MTNTERFAMADELRQVLTSIREGTVTVTHDGTAGSGFGDVTYTCSNGWTIAVFDDVGEWDYIDHAIAPDGRRLKFDWMWVHARDLVDYQPTDEEQTKAWGWPQ